MITKEGENPGKVGQGVTLSHTPHQQRQKPEEGLKAGAPNASLELPLDQLALGSREGPGSLYVQGSQDAERSSFRQSDCLIQAFSGARLTAERLTRAFISVLDLISFLLTQF